MGLETATTISGLNASWPLGTDPVAQGDNHIQLIKDVLKQQFTGGATGLASPVTVTASEMNALAGSGAGGFTIQEQLAYTGANLSTTIRAPAGTCILLTSSANLPLWNRRPGRGSDSFLRIVGPTGVFGAGSGGSNSASAGLSQTIATGTTNSTVLGISQIPSHTHGITAHRHWMFRNGTGMGSLGVADNVWQGSSSGGDFAYTMQGVSVNSGDPIYGQTSNNYGGNATQTAGGGLGHNHSIPSLGTITWQPKYIDAIEVIKVDPPAP
ncbi:MAG: hypothetical protein ACJARV_000058 [Candidatus Pseudothioglobus sp.]|jgi:hypothetical protein|tara:strand:- start:10575 stop:11378 length:804 start_codon:yes stop_codon:yes gene_type:complete